MRINILIVYEIQKIKKENQIIKLQAAWVHKFCCIVLHVGTTGSDRPPINRDQHRIAKPINGDLPVSRMHAAHVCVCVWCSWTGKRN